MPAFPKKNPIFRYSQPIISDNFSDHWWRTMWESHQHHSMDNLSKEISQGALYTITALLAEFQLLNPALHTDKLCALLTTQRPLKSQSISHRGYIGLIWWLIDCIK